MIDHDTIPEFSKSVISLKKPITKDVEKLIKDEKKTVKEIIGYEDIQEIGRNLSGMVSMLTKAIQQLTERIEKLEEKLNG
jgi:predicted  nucleic acid-binding Zn-ribbon protein